MLIPYIKLSCIYFAKNEQNVQALDLVMSALNLEQT